MKIKYNFDIRYMDIRYNRNGTMAVSAYTMSEAKNMCKAVHPTAKIISCVRRGEVYTKPTPHIPQLNDKDSKTDNSSSLGAALLGMAITAGVGLFLKKK